MTHGCREYSPLLPQNVLLEVGVSLSSLVWPPDGSYSDFSLSYRSFGRPFSFRPQAPKFGIPLSVLSLFPSSFFLSFGYISRSRRRFFHSFLS